MPRHSQFSMTFPPSTGMPVLMNSILCIKSTIFINHFSGSEGYIEDRNE